MYLQIMPPQEVSMFQMDIEFIAIVSATLVVSVVVYDKLKRKWANR